jgi:hypothetical protein
MRASWKRLSELKSLNTRMDSTPELLDLFPCENGLKAYIMTWKYRLFMPQSTMGILAPLTKILPKSYQSFTTSRPGPSILASCSINSRKPLEAYTWVVWFHVETDVQQDCVIGYVEHIEKM